MHWRLVYSADRKASERIFESTNRCAGDGVKLGDLVDRACALEKQDPGMEIDWQGSFVLVEKRIRVEDEDDTFGGRRRGLDGLSSILPMVQGWIRGEMGSYCPSHRYSVLNGDG